MEEIDKEQTGDKSGSSRNFIEMTIDKDLREGVYDTVCTRFPPEPNGFLHIGHAKSILLNYGLAQEYGGKFNMRFDDTNPTKEKSEFMDSIIRDVQWLGADYEDRLFYASDYFGRMYEEAVKLIKKGKAYISTLTADEIRETRGTLTEPGSEDPGRGRSIEENLRMFEEMKSGAVEDGAMTLRARIDMASPNMNMRDPILYRVAHIPHARTGDTWCIYPMYDFAHPLEDAFEGVTHSICTLEFEDHRPLYEWVVRECEFVHPPRQIEFAKLFLNNVVTGKRYIKKLVEDGIVDGWDDPRLVTIASLRRMGYTPASIRRFVELCGVSKANSVTDDAMLEKDKNNYFACIWSDGMSTAAAFCDVSTGAFSATVQDGDTIPIFHLQNVNIVTKWALLTDKEIKKNQRILTGWLELQEKSEFREGEQL